MKRTISNLLLAAAAIASVILIIYPHVATALTNRKQSFVIQEYDNALKQQSEEQLRQEWESAQAYNESRSAGNLLDPFSVAAGGMNHEYVSVLNIQGNGIMGSIQIPKIQVNLSIHHGTSEPVLNHGIGHLEGTDLPIGGTGTHSVLTGHTGLNTARMFSDLTELEKGDEFYIYILDQVLAYQIDQIVVVNPEDIEALRPVADKDYMTLITCTPYGVNSHRLFVRGERIDYTPSEIESRIKATKPTMGLEIKLLLAGVGVLMVIGVIAIKIVNKRKNI